jgi:hypothetical protein
MNARRIFIGVLIALNVLLAGLLLHAHTPRASAQVPLGARTDYLILPGEIQTGQEALYVIDTRRKILVCMRLDKSRKKLIAYKGTRNLAVDFGQDN